MRNEYDLLSSPRRHTGMSSLARSSCRSFSFKSRSTTFFAALPLRFAGRSAAWSVRCEAEDKISSWVSDSFIKTSFKVERRHRRHDRNPAGGASAGGEEA